MINKIDARTLRNMLLSGANNLQNNKDLVDKLNVFPVPDGDTGTNMSLTIASAVKELNKSTEENITVIGKAIAKGSLMGARGNSGVILSQIIRGFSKGIENKEELSSIDLANALKLGSDTAYKAVIKPVEGTILTVVRESAEYAVQKAKKEKDIVNFLSAVIKEANVSLNKTPDLLPALKDAGVVDSGAKGLIIFYEGMLESLKGNFIEASKGASNADVEIKNVEYTNPADIKFGYCTEFILESDAVTPEKIRDLMLPLGDSLAVVGDEGIIKVHVHTNDPGIAIQTALKYGQLVTVKIENMRLQHENLLMEESNQEVEEKEYAVIATSMGEGINSILKDFNVDHIIEGGQTMNPSTQDFLDAIEKVNAKNIIIFPNNSNIIMSANQAKELSDKNIVVMPTKNIPQCISALVNFDCTGDTSLEDNESTMLEAIQYVKSGQVTYAVRNTMMDGIDIKEGNYIGIANGKMSSANEDIEEVVLETLSKLVNEDSAIITLFYGQDITEEDARKISSKISDSYEDIDVEIYYGGQPVYYYLLAVE